MKYKVINTKILIATVATIQMGQIYNGGCHNSEININENTLFHVYEGYLFYDKVCLKNDYLSVSMKETFVALCR